MKNLAEDQDQEKLQEREEYLEERRMLIDLEKTSSASFDKAMLTLSGGALGLSINFFKDMAEPKSVSLLISSWSCFMLTLLLTSMSLLTSQYAIRRQREILDKKYEKGGVEKHEEGFDSNHWNTATSILNPVSIITFIVGLILTLCYCFKNLGGSN